MSSIMQKGFRRRQVNRWLLLLVIASLVLCSLVLVSHNLPGPRIPLARARSTIIKIMPLGDSITYGVGASTKGGYRLPLWNALKARGFSFHFVGSVKTGPSGFDQQNEGHPGWEINQIAAKVVNWLKTYRPNMILLHIGTNDFVKNYYPAQASTRLSHLLDLITTTLPGSTVIVAQIIPIPRNARLISEVTAYNAAIPGIVRADVARGKHVQYVDMYHVVPPNGMLPDQIHPNDIGYFQMANVWLRALLPLLSQEASRR